MSVSTPHGEDGFATNLWRVSVVEKIGQMKAEDEMIQENDQVPRCIHI